MIGLLLLLLTKHLVVDFMMQPKWMWSNKGTLGHWGGIAHAALHGVVTQIILGWYLESGAPMIAFLEIVAHYFIDWAKMNVCGRMGWKPDTSPYFWWMMGVDQFAHQLCYLWIVWMVVS